MIERNDPRILLPRVLVAVHRQALLDQVQAAGHDIDTWDPARISALPYEEFADKHIYEVDFDEQRIEVPVEVIGAHVLKIDSFRTSLDWIESHYHAHGRDNEYHLSMQAVVETVDAPSKAMPVFLRPEHAASRFNRAHILTIPDSPPVIVHDDDLFGTQEDISSPYNDSSLLPDVRLLCGENSVRYVSPAVCAKIIDAVRTGNPHIV